MLFCSQTFVLFFMAVFAIYWLTPSRDLRVGILLLASLIFYGTWSTTLVGVVVGTATIDFMLAHGIRRQRTNRGQRLLLILSIVMNLSVLCYFKYVNFFLESLTELAHKLGEERSLPILSVIAPLGISFYTFEAICYMVDVYRGKIEPERRLDHFLLFILFFPHLIAGPIVRAADFLPQVRKPKRWNWARMNLGLQLVVLGVVKKMVFADRMAMFADPVFADPLAYKTSALWMASIAYLVQVYCDFSGYSDMALGTAHMLGYRLCLNFNLPYIAENPAEFWRRWHISLSTWLRDYVFYPLGGSRHGELRTSLNLLIVFTLCGLWHGAAWRFVMWGFLTGVWMALHRGFRAICKNRPTLDNLLQTSVGTLFRIVCTLTIFTLTLTIFRSPTLTEGFTMLRRLIAKVDGSRVQLKPESFVVLLGLFIVAHMAAINERYRRIWDTLPATVRGLLLALAFTLGLFLSPDSGSAFIYFQF